MTPRRSEFGSRPFFPGANSGLGTGEWYQLLAVHEYRHAVQIHSMNYGVSKLMQLAFGNQGLAVSTNAAAPGWFWEGDAVVVETAFTRSGRGRMPSFDLHVRALLSAGIRYPYDKAMFRTYRDYYPNRYVLGYLLTSYVKRTYGPDAWERIIRRSNQLALLPLSFDLAVRGVTGRSTRGIYNDAMDELAVNWARARTTLQETDADVLLPANGRRWTNFAHPTWLPDGSILTIESGSQRTGVLYRIFPDGSVDRIGYIDPAAYFGGFSASGSTIVWSQTRSHPRWGNLEYSVLMTYDIQTRRSRALTHQSFYFVPSLSRDGQRIAAVEFPPDRQCSVVILDRNGRLLQKFTSPDNQFVSDVVWLDERHLVINRQNADRGKAISVVDLDSGAFRDVLPATFVDTWSLETSGRHVLFTTARGGIDQIAALDIDSGQLYEVVTRRLGAYYPNVSSDGKKIAFSDYSPGGLGVAVAQLDRSQWTELESLDKSDDPAIDLLTRQETRGAPVDVTAAPELSAPAERYKRMRDLFSVYGWTPAADENALAFVIGSRSLLNTLQTRAGVLYDRHASTTTGFAEARYAGAFPTIAMRAQYGGRTEYYSDQSGAERRSSWMESSISGSVAVPLAFDRGSFTNRVAVEAGVAATDVWDRDTTFPFENGNGRLTSARLAFAYSSQSARAVNDILSRWQSATFVSYTGTLDGSAYRGDQLYLALSQSIPGMRPQHVFRIVLEGEFQEAVSYRFDRQISVPRGYASYFAGTRLRGTATYVFPVAYPDLSIGSLLYSNRLLGALFADLGYGEDGAFNIRQSSAGLELLADLRVLRVPIPIRLGVRSLYRFEPGDFRFEPVIIL